MAKTKTAANKRRKPEVPYQSPLRGTAVPRRNEPPILFPTEPGVIGDDKIVRAIEAAIARRKK